MVGLIRRIWFQQANNREWSEVVSPSPAFSATANLNRSSELMSW
jgi:hypothetical protein